MLWRVISANLFYCLISVLIISRLEGLTGIGKAMLDLEILVILIVVANEWQVARKGFS
jgi:hypothetical protein